jgi:circadian clock protein KaiC
MMATEKRTRRRDSRDEAKSIAKAPTGIKGFDDRTGGGWPRARTSLVVGGPGAGKTLFALQALVHGAEQLREPGIFVAFEESSSQIIQNAATFGWDLEQLQDESLFFLDARLSPATVQAGDFDLAGILAGLAERVRAMKAKRIVFDGLDVLLTLLDDPRAERREAFRLNDWLHDLGLTGIITAKAASEADTLAERYAFMQFMVDSVLLLNYRLVDRVSLRSVRVLKYRGSSFSEGEFPLVITEAGVDVSTFGDVDLTHTVSNDRVTSGVDRLDHMMGGGYYRGSTVLITGAPGTSKTTLAAAAIEAACNNGERALFVSFDEPVNQLLRNVQSVGIDLEKHVRNGRLHVHAVRTETKSAEEHLIDLKRRIAMHQPQYLALDPLSALEKTGGQIAAKHAALRIIDYAKCRNITTVCTSLTSTAKHAFEETELAVSTIADTWIHLEYVAMGGERNRALTIIKSRGMKHSNQVRELILSDEGPSLTDVYSSGGEVLVGTARWEMEQKDRRTHELARLETERRQHELALTETEITARMAALERELALKRAELELFMQSQQTATSVREADRDEVVRRRGGEMDKSTRPNGKTGASGKRGSGARRR